MHVSLARIYEPQPVKKTLVSSKSIPHSVRKAIRIVLMFIHLTTHSAYPLQEGLTLPSEMEQAAQADGMPALRPQLNTLIR
jgi:hypothetical protein